MATTIFDDLQVMRTLMDLHPQLDRIIAHLPDASTPRLVHALMPSTRPRALADAAPARPASKALAYPTLRGDTSSSSQVSARRAVLAPRPGARACALRPVLTHVLACCARPSHAQLDTVSSRSALNRGASGKRITKVRSSDSIRSNLASAAALGGMHRRASDTRLCVSEAGAEALSDAQLGEPRPLMTLRTAGTDSACARDAGGAPCASRPTAHARSSSHLPRMAGAPAGALADAAADELCCEAPAPPVGVSADEMSALVAVLLAQHPQGVIEPSTAVDTRAAPSAADAGGVRRRPHAVVADEPAAQADGAALVLPPPHADTRGISHDASFGVGCDELGVPAESSDGESDDGDNEHSWMRS